MIVTPFLIDHQYVNGSFSLGKTNVRFIITAIGEIKVFLSVLFSSKTRQSSKDWALKPIRVRLGQYSLYSTKISSDMVKR